MVDVVEPWHLSKVLWEAEHNIDVNEVVKINHQAEVVFKSGNLSVILPDLQFPVLKLFEKNKKLYCVTSNQIIVLDQYGSLLNTINLKATNGLIIKEESLIGYDGNFILSYNYLDYKTDTIYQTNSYDKIIQCQEQIIGILKGNYEANSWKERGYCNTCLLDHFWARKRLCS